MFDFLTYVEPKGEKGNSEDVKRKGKEWNGIRKIYKGSKYCHNIIIFRDRNLFVQLMDAHGKII